MSDDSDGGPLDDPGAPPEVPIKLEDLLEAAEHIADHGPNIRDAMRRVLRDTVQRTGGEAAQVIEILAKVSGCDVATVRAMFHDERCTFGQFGVVATPAALAAAWLQDTASGPDGATVIHTEGGFHVRHHHPDASPFYKREDGGVIERGLMCTVPHHPLVQRANGRRETVEEIAKLCSAPDFFDEEQPGLQLRNGFLTIDPTTGEVLFLGNSAEIRSRWVVEAVYDEDADCPVFKAGLTLIMPDQQSQACLLEKQGAAVLGLLLPGDNANSITLIVGPPQAGKSTIVRVLEMLVPPEMRAALQPADMGERFMAVELEGKRLNLVTELDVTRKIGGPVLKAVSSRETITARQIRERARSITPRAAQVWLANDTPQIDDKTGAYLRRISAFRLNRALTRKEVDSNFVDKIRAELPGIVNLIVRHAANAVKRGYFLQPTEQDELMAEMRGERDVVTQAIAESVVRRPGARLTNQELFALVRKYGAAKGIELGQVHLVSLGRRVANAMRQLHRVAPSPTKAHGGVPFYEGVGFAPLQTIEI